MNDNANANMSIATKPLIIEAVNAHLTASTALSADVPTILIPANKNPMKYSLIPSRAYAASSMFFSLLKIEAIGSDHIYIAAMISTASTSAVLKASPTTYFTSFILPLP